VITGRKTGSFSGGAPSFAASLLLMALRGYRQWISPMLGHHCRFHPSCSAYAEEAMAVHGIGKGLGLALMRLARCHPFHPGGVDPVPAPRR
jgi:hypothetical protein